MFDFSKVSWVTKEFGKVIEDYGFDRDFIFLVFFGAVFATFFLPNSMQVNEKLEGHPYRKMCLTVLLLVVGFVSVGRISPFLYFNF